MNKWIVIAVILAAGGFWYKSSQEQAAARTAARLQAGQEAASAQAAPPPGSRTPTEAQCREVGGRIIEGMGCVVGAPEAPVNSGVAPEEMASVCQSLNQRYVRELNACVSS